MELKRASQFSLAELTAFWNLGYTGYFIPIQFTEAQMENWIRCGDLDLDRSLVLMDGDKPAGFSFLGVRGDRGWIGGFGITPDYRGKGLAYSLFADHLKRIELDHVQLEVLVENWASKVYAAAGFVTERRLSILRGKLPDGGNEQPVRLASPQALLPHSERLHAEAPAPWQRQPAWLTKSLPANANALYTGPADQPTGFLCYRVLENNSLTLLDAAAPGRPEADQLVAMLARLYPGFTVTILNEPEGSAIHQALTAAGCTEFKAQYEMHWRQGA